jgi:predicted metal-dependent HD superfamily phosphohydrolase
LNRPRIYRTERMFAAAEEAARTNLRAEIERLAISGAGDGGDQA